MTRVNVWSIYSNDIWKTLKIIYKLQTKLSIIDEYELNSTPILFPHENLNL